MLFRPVKEIFLIKLDVLKGMYFIKFILGALFALLLIHSPVAAEPGRVISLAEVVAITSHGEPSDHNMIRTVQRSLHAHNLYSGQIDGIFGPQTIAGVELAQRIVSPWVVPVIRMDIEVFYIASPQAAGVHVAGENTVPNGTNVYGPIAPWQIRHISR